MSLRGRTLRGRARLLLGVLALSSGVASGDELPEKWRNWTQFRSIEIGAGESGLVRLPVPESLLAAAESDLRDVRVIDDRGESVGYVLYARGRGPSTEWRSTQLLDAGSVPGRYAQVVADTGSEGVLHSSAEVTLGEGEGEVFVWVEVAASDDRETWRVVRERAPLYRFRQDVRRPRVYISYPATRDRWLRLRLLEGGDTIPVNEIRVAERVEEEPDLVPIETSLTLHEDSPDDESWWEPDGRLGTIPLSAVVFETDREVFHRGVCVFVSDDGERWTTKGSGAIYRYEEPRPDGPRQRERLRVSIRETAARHWRVAILDRDDAPIDDLGVSFLRNVRYLVLRAQPERSYRLIYGNPKAEAPEYEIVRIIGREQQATAPVAGLGEEVTNAGWVSGAPFTERHPVLLWIALGLAVAVVAGLAFKTLRS